MPVRFGTEDLNVDPLAGAEAYNALHKKDYFSALAKAKPSGTPQPVTRS
jgi:hypothetical protein